VIAAGFPQVGIGPLGVALAFGLTLLTMAYAIGHISGCKKFGISVEVVHGIGFCASADPTPNPGHNSVSYQSL
jgi:hypothetical protein